MLVDDKRVYDGYASLAGGQDAGRNPSLIEESQCAASDNLVFRGGVPTTRPGIRVTAHEYTNPHMFYNADDTFGGQGTGAFSSRNNHEQGIFQGACYYAPGGGKAECMMFMVGGRLYQVIPRPHVSLAGFSETMEITEIPLDKLNHPTKTKAYLVQADRFCVIQDGQSKAIVYDGVTARRALDDEVPVGTIMAYGMGRLVVTVNGDREVAFSDIYGSNEDANDPGAAVLKFTETTFLNEGGTASIAFALGRITGLHFVPQQDSSVGDGELLAFSEGGISSFQLALPREQWKESAFQRVALYNIGARGWRSIVSINGDVWFRSDDGWRSYRQARAEISGWAHLPMSTEVRTWTENDTVDLLEYGSAIAFDNRLISTCTPQPNNGQLFHNGLLSLDFDVLSSFGKASRPAWDGHWSPTIRVCQLVQGAFNGEHKAFVFSLHNPVSQFFNYIHEITKDDRVDSFSIFTRAAVPIAWELITRSFDFKTPFNEKSLYGGDLWVDDVEAVTVTASFKADQKPDWTAWQSLPSITSVGTPQEITNGGVPTLRPGYYPRRTFTKPPDGCDSAQTGRMLRRGYEFQIRLTGVGHCSLRKLRVHAREVVENARAQC